MAELADAHGSGPCGSNTMRVQVPFSALYRAPDESQELFCTIRNTSRLFITQKALREDAYCGGAKYVLKIA